MGYGERWASGKRPSSTWHTTHSRPHGWHLQGFSSVIPWEIVGDAKDAALPSGSRQGQGNIGLPSFVLRAGKNHADDHLPEHISCFYLHDSERKKKSLVDTVHCLISNFKFNISRVSASLGSFKNVKLLWCCSVPFSKG